MTDISDIQAGELHYETPDYGKPKSTEEFWSGEFGDQYTLRNRYSWRRRIPFWNNIIEKTGARAVFEFGCNVGYNLSAIKYENDHVKTYGDDVNKQALDIADAAGHKVFQYGQSFFNLFDITFTAGVLIHIAPQDLQAFMQRIIDASYGYVIAIEYFAEQEEEVEYRGHTGKLWKRNYGKLYQDLGLKLIEQGDVGKNDGFDNCRWWLLSR